MSLQTNTNPFVGLRPFESDESLLFFGRQEQTVELLQRLHRRHFVAIIGNSGSGKSSLIRGGLIPRLKAGYLIDGQDRWMITMMKPGQSPLHNLAETILKQLKPGSDDQAVTELVKKIKEEGADVLLDILKPLWEVHYCNFFLLVDQFEELFRFSMNQKEVEKKDNAIDFVNIILEISKQTDLPVYVVMTMRSDFIGDCADFPGLPEAMNQSQYLIPRLNRGNLRNAIEGPVKLYGSSINPALTTRLLNDAGMMKDELPLLQHALMRIWDYEMNKDKSSELDLNDYEKIGGMERALSDHADEALEGMTENELALTKKIFQALTIIDENGRKVRRPALISELEAITGEDKTKLLSIINRFSEEKKSFLVISKEGNTHEELIDISHESLIRQWKTLSAWTDEESASAKIYLHLKESAELYKEKKKDLLDGSEFQIAMQWYKTINPSAVWAQRYNKGFEESIEYLLTSEKEQRVIERRKRSGKRNRLILLFSSVVFLLIALSFYILRQKLLIIKEAFRLNSLAQEEVIKDPTVALRIGQAAYAKYADTAIKLVSEKIYQDNAFYKTIIRDSYEIPSIAVSDTSILTGSFGKSAKLWSMDGRLLAEFKGVYDTVWAVAFSPVEGKVLTGSSGNSAILWDLQGHKLREFKGHQGSVKAVAFSPDGTKVLTGSNDSTAILRTLDGQIIKKFEGHKASVKAVAFSPDGKKIVTGSKDSTAIIWTSDGNRVGTLKRHKNVISSVAFSSDSKKILTGSHDYTAILWNIDGGIIKEFTGQQGAVISAAFSPGDESRILIGSYDGTARLWSIDGVMLNEFKGNSDKLRASVFLPDGSKIITTDTSGTVRLWTLGKNFSKEFQGHKEFVVCVAFSPDNKKILTGSFDNTARLWNLDDTLFREFKGNGGKISAVAFSPDSSKILICSGNTPELINLAGGPKIELKGHTGNIYSIAFSQKGDKILTGSADGTARLWFPSDGSSVKEIKGDGSAVLAVTFSSDGSRVLIISGNKTLSIFNTDGSNVSAIKIDNNKIPLSSAAFSPDGTKVISGYEDGTIRLLSLTGDNDDFVPEFRGHEDAVFSVAFSPDGSKILTGSEDKKVKLWNLKGVCLSVLTGHTDCVLSVAFSKDGKMLLSGSEDMKARLWNNMLLEDFWKSDLIDQLTNEQKKEFGIGK